MHEIVSTRHNELIDPFLQVWSWQIPTYLFLGGFVAGTMIIAGYLLLTRRHPDTSIVRSTLPGLSLVLLSAGMFALFLDLEHKLYVWRLYTTFQARSPMSWGSWILLAVYPALLGAWLSEAPAVLVALHPVIGRLKANVNERATIVRTIGIANVALGVMLGVYTGILLSSFGARPFWNSALLGPLFLASGLSSAAAFTHLIARDPHERWLFAKTDNYFLASELAIVCLFLIGLLTASQAHIDAAHLVLGGPYTGIFWVGVVSLGILLPLLIQSLAVAHRIEHTPIAPVFVLAGGLLLRFVFVYAGQFSHWSSGIEVMR